MCAWIVAIALLAAIFFATLAGTALRSIPVERLRALKESGGETAERIGYWITHSEQIVWALRVASRVSCVALALAVTAIVAREPFPLYAFFIGLAVTGLLVAFPGSLVPMIWGKRAAERVGLRLIPALRFFGTLLAPFITACEAAVNACLRIIGRPPLRFSPISLRGELESIIGEERNAAALDEDEKRMIRHIFEFGDTEVKEIMTPRLSMRCLGEGETVRRAVGMIREEHHSRIPVYRDSPDSIVGILYAKDLLDLWAKGGGLDTPLGALAREALFVPETKKVDELFDQFRRLKTHMAIVVDEYGCTSGLVTMEDILEEIVGEIQDEYDVEERPMCEPLGGGVYRVDARLPVAEAREEFGIDIPEGEGYDTIAGFVYAACGRVPAAGETIRHGAVTVKVLEASGRAVKRLEIRQAPESRRGKGARAGPGSG